MVSIYNLTYSQMIEKWQEMGYKPFKAQQLYAWLYKRRIFDVQQMTDLSKDFRQYLTDGFDFGLLKEVTRQVSSDGTIKFLFECVDGALVETVIMFHSYGPSICVSSQVGCAMGCVFCASGLLMKQRDLTSGEMVLQVLMGQLAINERIGNVVVMGSGEPFDNYQPVMDFLDIINSDYGLAIGARHITVSTCGIVPRIRQFAHEKQYNLAISLHAPNDELRNQLMKVNHAYPLKELQAALLDYQKIQNRRLSFEYILLKGLNDQPEHVTQLKNFMRMFPNSYVNLIPYNAVNEHGLNGVTDIEALKFYDRLKKIGLAVTLRTKHGDDIDAACGQLRNKHRSGVDK
jgi:23S rRNA (adenine2503-C2)-methyltransferase